MCNGGKRGPRSAHFLLRPARIVFEACGDGWGCVKPLMRHRLGHYGHVNWLLMDVVWDVMAILPIICAKIQKTGKVKMISLSICPKERDTKSM